METQLTIQNAVDKYNAENDTHSDFPPSSSKRWCNCTASYGLIKQVEEKSSGNQYTAEGTMAHILCELLLTQKINTRKQLDDAIGDTYMVGDFEIEVTEEMVDAVWLFGETIISDVIAAGLNKKNYSKLLSVEKRVKITDECEGTSDCYLVIPFEKIIVYDFKYGAGVAVDVEDNYQMKCYAVGALADYEKCGNSGLNDIELVIVQPRGRHSDGSVRRWTTTRQEILDFKSELKAFIKECKGESPQLKTGSWCRWCPAKHICPQMFNEAQDIAKKAFDVIDVGQDVLVAMSDKQLKEILDKKDTIVNFLNAVEAFALDKLASGETIKGYKLVRGRTTRQWCNPDEVAARLDSVIPEDDLYTKKFVSPAQLEKVLRNKGVCKTVKEASEYISEWVGQSEGKLSIAPEYDSRDPVLLNAGDYFKEKEIEI